MQNLDLNGRLNERYDRCGAELCNVHAFSFVLLLPRSHLSKYRAIKNALIPLHRGNRETTVYAYQLRVLRAYAVRRQDFCPLTTDLDRGLHLVKALIWDGKRPNQTICRPLIAGSICQATLKNCVYRCSRKRRLHPEKHPTNIARFWGCPFLNPP